MLTWGKWTVVVAVVTGAACNALSGIDDVRFDGATGQAGAPVGDGGGGESTTSSGGAGGRPDAGQENCTNGEDDDLDGDVDCADDACADYWCVPGSADALVVVPAPPSGICPAPLDELPLFECAGCACNVSEGTCKIESHSFSDDACTVPKNTYTESTACVNAASPGDHQIEVVTSPQTAGACSARTGSVPASSQLYCAGTMLGSCPGGLACAPPALAPATTCVFLPVDTPCPPGLPTAQPVFSNGAVSCDCGCAASHACEGGSVSYFSGAGCTQGATTLGASEPCTLVTALSVKAEQPKSVTTCTPQAGLAAAQTKLCCPPDGG